MPHALVPVINIVFFTVHALFTTVDVKSIARYSQAGYNYNTIIRKF
ncbi:hypothetical protein HMPREF0083_03948 [Aneurinibacillus aneurinilyticus ATCC 12856]|uniref:ABC transmembrane type-1 domain-containing protein n=1 Tax=Aneurinibacillus aneurinilyticus ATCC 12856 TaxID=649747 RepID=U1WZ15_ANEAE|nr:hypothetical protein HMPREF0083_03948 [Aneurinibacillus aneurinilyticus ATCC 12856]